MWRLDDIATRPCITQVVCLKKLHLQVYFFCVRNLLLVCDQVVDSGLPVTLPNKGLES